MPATGASGILTALTSTIATACIGTIGGTITAGTTATTA